MPRRVLLGTQRDFSGGLNLRADPFSLGANESPDLLNVDVDPRGGFALRRAAATYANDAGGTVHSLFGFKTTGGTQQVFAGVGTAIKYTTGTTWTTLTATRAGPLRQAIFKDRVYIQNGVDAPLRWDGSAEHTLAEGFNNNLSAPTVPPANGKGFKAKATAVHMGCVFIANIVESGVAFKNRIRWSHPNFPEDWADFHFIDVDTGHDGDEITALMPLEDRLLVFKRDSVFVVYGEPPDRLQIQPLTREAGAANQEAVVLTDLGVYFWSPDDGVFLYDGNKLQYVFERIRPAVESNDIPALNEDKIQLGWGNRRLWVATPFEGSSTRNRVFVLDPSLGKLGSWVKYDLPVGPFLEWQPSGAEPLFLAAHVGGSRVLKLEQDATTDDFGSGAVHINSHYQTYWFDLGAPALEKRWRHPEIVIQQLGSAGTITVQAFRDYNPSTIYRQFTLELDADQTPFFWDVSDWNEAYWGYEGLIRLSVERGATLGSARAISLKFVGPTANIKWVVDSISLKYIPKRVR